MFEVASLACRSNRTARLNQPSPFGARSGVAAAISGAVASYLRAKPSGPLRLPALSRQVPGTDAVALSGPLYVVAVQESIPDIGSVPLNAIPTWLLYQPFASGGRAAAPPSTVGAVSS